MIFDGPVKVVDVYFKGEYCGRTTAATTIEEDKDWLDIVFQQTGTKPDDKTETGCIKKVTCTFGEITTNRLVMLMNGMQKNFGGSLNFASNSYTSLRQTMGGKLELIAVHDGIASTDPLDKITFYEAVPEVTGAINWDVSAQMALPVTFHCFKKKIKNIITDEDQYSFGYMGVASSFGLPEAT